MDINQFVKLQEFVVSSKAADGLKMTKFTTEAFVVSCADTHIILCIYIYIYIYMCWATYMVAGSILSVT